MTENKAVLYLRLSKEDIHKVNEGDDSASIVNQRLLLVDYALLKGFEVVDIYSDDDESGLYDDRPEFARLLRDAKLGKFNVVIAKSQSRFTRNMEHLEKYLHHDFVLLGIRFIGLVDNVDTAVEGNKKARQIAGLVNEWYCEDLSKNIRETFKVKMKAGQFLGSSAPYGYVKDPEDHHRLVIDEYAASIVKKIFQLYLDGYGKAKIGAMLTDEGILIPSIYKTQVLKQNYYNANQLATTKLWSFQTIHTILNNPVYLGHVVQNKCSALSYKNRKKKAVPKEEWIVVKNMHEAIIDEETFESVKKRQKIRAKSIILPGREGNGLFFGKMFCQDCKHAMCRKYARRGEKGFIGYMCSVYKVHGKAQCESHSIGRKELEAAVLLSVQKEARKILTETDREDLKNFQIKKEAGSIPAQREQINVELMKIAKYKKKAYESFAEEILSRKEYLDYKKAYEQQEETLKQQLEAFDRQLEENQGLENQYDTWTEAFKDYIHVDTLTREMVNELIEKIEVDAEGNITIFYKFCNPFSEE